MLLRQQIQRAAVRLGGALAAAAMAATLALAQAPPAQPPASASPAAAPVGASPAAPAANNAAPATDKVDRELERFRGMLDASDPFSNPGYLFVDRGADLWAKPSGPREVALAGSCDLGLGVGKVDGAYARMPRYFPDVGRVLDLEGRLLWCMVNLQGRSMTELIKNRFSTPERTSELEDLTAFIASKSNGQPLAAPLEHVKEKQARALGEAIFFRRQGPWDFACATCHGEPGKRIRLQALPAFDVAKEAQAVMRSWPAYRVSQNTLRTMQHRLYDCFWQMRLPAVDYASDVTVALTSYLAAKGAGGIIEAPSIKR